MWSRATTHRVRPAPRCGITRGGLRPSCTGRWSSIVGVALQVINGQGYLLFVLGVLGCVGLPAGLYLRYRHAIARHFPTGWRIRIGFGEARFALETPLSSSTTSYAAYRSARRHGAFVVLRAPDRRAGRPSRRADLARGPRPLPAELSYESWFASTQARYSSVTVPVTYSPSKQLMSSRSMSEPSRIAACMSATSW